MTVAAVTPITEYVENGSTIDFAVPFQFRSSAHLVVSTIDPDTDVETLLTLGVGYTVTGGSGATGTVHKTSPAAAGTILRIRRRTPRAQTTDYETSADFPAETHEAALDTLAMAIQELDQGATEEAAARAGLAARALRVIDGQTIEPIDKTDFAGKFYTGDADGNLVPSSGGGADDQLRPDLAESTGATLVGTSKGVSVESALFDEGEVHLKWFSGPTDKARWIDAYNATPEGGRLVMERGAKSSLGDPLTFGRGGDVETAKDITIDWDGHEIEFTADGAKLAFLGPVSDVLYLSADYVKGSREINVTATPAQIADIARGTKLKIVSDALDGWNRNQGTQTNQYRHGEWTVVRKIVHNGDGTATITTWHPLKFTDGFTNTGDAEALTLGASYTTANNARLVAVPASMRAKGTPKISVADAASHIGAGGWSNDPLVTFSGWDRPAIDNITFGDTTGRGLQVSGCYDPQVEDVTAAGRIPDFSEQLANDGVSTSNYGYLLAIAGCWLGSLGAGGGSDARHLITENGSTSAANTQDVDTVLAMGRTYGTRVIAPSGAGQYSAPVDTHHGAHAWTFMGYSGGGTQFGGALNLRGPDHRVIAGSFIGEEGVSVISEWADAGGTDLPALNGNGDEWMSSATLVACEFDVTHKAVRAQSARVFIEGGATIRSRSHHVFDMLGGRIEAVSGYIDVTVSGEAQATTLNGDSTARGIAHIGSTAAQYGLTWTPGFRLHSGATLAINAAAAVDGATMDVFRRSGSTGEVVIEGTLVATVPASGMGTLFGNSVYWTIASSAVLDVSGNSSIASAFPKWTRGKTRIANLAPSVAQRLFSFYDGPGSLTEPFWGTVKVYAADAGAAALVAEYQFGDSFSGGSSAEVSFLLSGSTSDFEANSNVDLVSVAPTSGKIGLSYFGGALYVRHEKAGVTYEDVFAEISIHRQPVKA